MHTFLLCIFIGLGVAMPLGPINIEIMRRNLHDGFRYGFAVGVGATSADLTYILLLVSGVLAFLQNDTVLRVVGIVGSIILCWFAYKAFTTKTIQAADTNKPLSLWRCVSSGYAVALLSPFNLLFWASLTTQVANITEGSHFGLFFAGLGVVCGALLWLTTLNCIIHFTRHRLNDKVVHWLNMIGGVILFGFAIYGFVHALM
tara:strand:- start:12734 stop:13339 length:606 start_codon:yes stop_codon:yes gene_type:complete